MGQLLKETSVFVKLCNILSGIQEWEIPLNSSRPLDINIENINNQVNRRSNNRMGSAHNVSRDLSHPRDGFRPGNQSAVNPKCGKYKSTASP